MNSISHKPVFHCHCHDRLAPRVLEAFRNEQTEAITGIAAF